tara:strand:- start:42903 stop:43481 length:579 start_codon:yes stop_codon:yes gene_type:complete
MAFDAPKRSPKRTPGGTYFLTLRLAERGGDLLVQRIALLRRAMRETLARHPFQINAIAVLPDVIHTIWTLPAGDSGYPNRIGMWKSRFSRGVPMPAHRSLAQIKRGEKGIWQRRYWQHQIRDAADFARHRDLIYLSPVHAGLCLRPQDWQFTSLHRDLARGAAQMPDLTTWGDAAPLHLAHPPRAVQERRLA